MSEILKEDGDAILKEDGDFLLLEGGVIDTLTTITEIVEVT